MSKVLEVSTAQITDLDDLVPLFDAYRQFYRKLPNADAARQFLLERLTNRDSAIFLARALNGKALGFAQMYKTMSSVMMDPVWLLNDLYVSLEGRRTGTGRALIEKAKAHALRSGAKYIRVMVHDHNTGAQKIYESLDFKKDHEHSLYHCNLDD
jgi:ribosomal protein S18 acetylase RimI-like enzyme